jgi:acetyl esterase/lipase
MAAETQVTADMVVPDATRANAASLTVLERMTLQITATWPLPTSHAQRGSESPPPALGGTPMPLEPTTQQFINGLAGARPLYELTPAEAHQVLTDLQPAPVAKRPADFVDTTFPVGPTGETRIRIVRPQGAQETLPVVMYFHGGRWVLGDTITHDRLVREIADGVHAAVVFVD